MMTEQEIPEWAWKGAAWELFREKRILACLPNELGKKDDDRRIYRLQSYSSACPRKNTVEVSSIEAKLYYLTCKEANADLSRNQVTDEMMALACQAYESVSEYPYNAEALKRAIQAVVKDSNV